jgi:anion-transporting  ArsA/GET3 family ATPase
MTLDRSLAGRRIYICVGSGGVGKTTTAAAIAIGLAAAGRRVAVVTIDPARRLADALGLDELSNQPRRVSGEHLAATGVKLHGELWAMVLDPKKTFDDLIERIAPDAATRERVLGNHLYREISSALGASHEFSAVAKLFELDREGGYDAIVLDTPPSRDAIEFLRAPQRLTQLFDARTVRLLVAPAGIGARLALRAGAPVFSLLKHLVGVDLLGEIITFFIAVQSLIGDFRQRAAAVDALLGDDATAFVLVSSPERTTSNEAVAFATELRARNLTVAALIVNRVHQPPFGDGPGVNASLLAATLDQRLARRVGDCVADAARRAAHDSAVIEQLRHQLTGVEQTIVPQLGAQIDDLATLGCVVRCLFPGPAQ